MTKHRLMLSAAAAALLVCPWAISAARADLDITTTDKNTHNTVTDGTITIETSGAISVKTGSPAVTMGSNNPIINLGTISNTATDGATGVLINTSVQNLVPGGSGFSSLGTLDLTGDGASKTGVLILGNQTYYAPISFTTVTSSTQLVGSGTLSTSTLAGSSIQINGDNSTAFYLVQGTTIDGNVNVGGSIDMTPSKNSTAAGSTLFYVEGNMQGNLVFDQTSSMVTVGNLARGLVVTGPISPCVDNASVGYTCAASGAASNVGALVLSGSIQSIGTITPNVKGGNPEGGSVVVLANSIAGGFLLNGPGTANGNTAVATLTGSGEVNATTGNNFPVLLIDPGQSLTTISQAVRGPAILGVISAATDSIDPGKYSFINRGTITSQPIDTDISSIASLIQGASAVNFTCLGTVSGGTCNPTGVGGLLNTGTISAHASTGESSTSNVSATGLAIGTYATIPRIVVSGEQISGTSTTPGTINAVVNGPGGGTATALAIANLATVPEIDVLTRGTISAGVGTTTISPTADVASASTPLNLISAAIVDNSGSVRRINNAGNIVALNTVLTPASDAVVASVSHAIDLQSNTSGGVVINNSGNIQGDVYFGSGGGGNILNVGNTGNSTGTTIDSSGVANAQITAVQGSAVTNTPFSYAVIASRIDTSVSGLAPVTETGLIDFGTGTGNELHIGGYSFVNAVVHSAIGGVQVDIDNNGELFLANTASTGSLNASNFNVNGGILGLTISQGTSSTTPVVLASQTAHFNANARIGLQFGGFISSATVANPTSQTPQTITLVSAPTINVDAGALNNYNAALEQAIPFLFESPGEHAVSGSAVSTAPAPLTLVTPGGGANQSLVLTLVPRSPGKTNADGTAGLGLSGDAFKLFPYTAAALGNDSTLGAAIATNLSVYNTAGSPTSGLNISASQQKAQQIFSQFSPDVSGGTRQVAIMITDQATGPVGSRQRLLRSYADGDGEMTLWGNEYAGNINNKGRFDGEGDLTAYKDHGFGFVLGLDAGSARSGWYGGALTFYSGDVTETLPRSSKTNEQWYMLTGYTDWHGRHIFLDTQASLGYGKLDGNRTLVIGNQDRDALGKRAALLGALGGTAGLDLKYGGLHIMPQISIDGMSMREEGYYEANGGDGLDLQVAPYYGNSLRGFLGTDVKENINVFDITLTPDARIGYRYDLVNSPVKLKAGFESTGGLSAPGNTFTFIGPDPDTGNVVAGLGLNGGNDVWSLGLDYDWIRGNNGSTTQVGTLKLLGRI